MMPGFRSAIIFLIALNLTAKNELGLGIAVGDPTGISVKYWTGKNTAIGGACGWSFRGEDYLQINGDFLYHYFEMIPVEKGALPFYIGVGGRLAFKEETEIGVRVPIGLEYLFEDAPFDVFFEVSPYLNLYPESDFDASASIGGRFFFDL
jgi:hypothetical protein